MTCRNQSNVLAAVRVNHHEHATVSVGAQGDQALFSWIGLVVDHGNGVGIVKHHYSLSQADAVFLRFFSAFSGSQMIAIAQRTLVCTLSQARMSQGHRDKRITLRSYKVEATPLPKVGSKLIRDTRNKLHCSRAVFARKLRINERTLEKWEQGRAKPNPQAAALVLLVRKFPDTLERLERVAAG